MFDESGNLIIPKDAFKNIEITKGEWKVKCPSCGHIIRMRSCILLFEPEPEVTLC